MDTQALLRECVFKAIRSSGSGGQHVNKVSTKMELQFNVATSLVLSEPQKQQLKQVLYHRLTKDFVLILQCAERRSQYQNKLLIKKRFITLITDSLKVEKIRIPTKTPKAVIQRRLKNKRSQSLKKANRRKPDVE